MSNDVKVRYTVVFSDEAYQTKLADIAKQYKISQGEVLEILIDSITVEQREIMKVARAEKLEARAESKRLRRIEKLRGELKKEEGK